MILVTGATGFVGRYLISSLLETGKYKLKVLLRTPPQTDNAHLEYYIGDIRNKALVHDAVNNVEYVIHLASVVSSRNYQDYEEVNVKGTQNLVAAGISHNVKRIIYLSSYNVNLPVKNYYSISKGEAEQIIAASGLKYIILRSSVICGEGDKGVIGKLIGYARKHSVIPLAGDGQSRIQPIYVGDVVKVIRTCLEQENIEPGIYNIAGMDIITYRDIICKLSEIFAKKLYPCPIPFSALLLSVRLLSLVQPSFSAILEKLKTYKIDKVVSENDIERIFGISPQRLENILLACAR